MKTIELSEAKRLVAEGAAMTADERLKIQHQRLQELVAYAREHSPYYAKLYADVPADFQVTDLPVTQKAQLMENYDDWVTDRRIHRQDVIDYLNRDMSHGVSLFLDQYTALRTSGSTGNPLLMVRDDHRNKIHSQLILQRLLGNVDLSQLDFSKHRRAAIIHISNGASSYAAALRAKAARPESAHNLLVLSVLDSVDHLVQQLNEFQPEDLSGYPSMLVQLALQQLKGNLHLDLKLIATSAELLTEENYWLLRDAFHCPVANNYCMTEGGEIAMTHDCPHLHINEDWVIVEPVDEYMQPLGQSSEWSAGLLVTDLTNYVQPVIRYFVNDVIRINREPLDCCSLPRLEIRGRSLPGYTLCGKTFRLVNLFSQTNTWPNLVSYQFVQIDDSTIQVRGVCSAGADPAKVLGELCSHLKTFLVGQGALDANITWSTEPLIPNKHGGKIPVYVKL